MVDQLNQLPTSLEPIGSVGNSAPVIVSPIWYKFFATVASLFTNSGGGGPASALLDTLGSTLGGMLARFGGGWAEFVASAPNQVPVMNPAAPVVLKNISQLLDLLGSLHGDILFRGAAAWEVLAPSAGGFLQSHGAGFDPTYGTVTPGAPDTSVQFNNGGTFGGNAGFTFDVGSGLVTLPALEVTTGDVNTPDGVGATDDGISFTFTAGSSGATSGRGGDVTFTAGRGKDDTGGDIVLDASDSDGVATGGGVEINSASGGTTSGDGGLIAITAGNGNVTGDGGDIGLTAGDGGATSGDGGDVTIDAGNANGSSNGGSVEITGGAGFGGQGGNAILSAGSSNSAGNGGDAGLLSGSGSGAFDGGALEIIAGHGGVTGNGGGVTITSGAGGATSGNGGDITLTPGTKTLGTLGHIKMVTLENFADDVAAAAGGVPITGLYRTASAVKVRVT